MSYLKGEPGLYGDEGRTMMRPLPEWKYLS